MLGYNCLKKNAKKNTLKTSQKLICSDYQGLYSPICIEAKLNMTAINTCLKSIIENIAPAWFDLFILNMFPFVHGFEGNFAYRYILVINISTKGPKK